MRRAARDVADGGERSSPLRRRELAQHVVQDAAVLVVGTSCGVSMRTVVRNSFDLAVGAGRAHRQLAARRRSRSASSAGRPTIS